MYIPTVIVVYVLFFTLMFSQNETSPLPSGDEIQRSLREIGQDSTCFGNIPICNTTNQYPELYIERLLTRYRRKYNTIFGNVIEPAPEIDRSLFRSSMEKEEEGLCKTRKVTVMPRTAYDENMKKRYIVNLENHLQSVTFETCAETKCYGSERLDSLNFQTYCQQRYSVVRLLYLDEEKNTIEYGRFSIPSTCVCTYSRLLRP